MIFLFIVSASSSLLIDAKINIVVDDAVVKTYSVVIFGDVNGDAIIDGNDVSSIVSVAGSLLEFNECQTMAADVNGDGKQTIADVVLIMRYLAGMDVVLK